MRAFLPFAIRQVFTLATEQLELDQRPILQLDRTHTISMSSELTSLTDPTMTGTDTDGFSPSSGKVDSTLWWRKATGTDTIILP
jgi:hypothetical protein